MKKGPVCPALTMHDDRELKRKFGSILPSLDERQRRLIAAAEARSLGYGGIRIAGLIGHDRSRVDGIHRSETDARPPASQG